MTDLIAPHGGYKNLKSFQAAEIISDLTVEFCRRYVQFLKQREQMEGAARSGKQNIGEGSRTSGTSKQSEIRLIDVARASLEELKLDYEDFLRTHNLSQWDKNDPRAREIRALAYKADKSYMTYSSYLSDAETAANCLITLINQANFLLDRQLKALSSDLKEKGDFRERYRQARKEKIIGTDADDLEFLRQQGFIKLKDGRVARLDE